MNGLEELGQFAAAMAPGWAWGAAECAAVGGLVAAAVARAARPRRRDEGHLADLLPPPLAEERRTEPLSPQEQQAWDAIVRRLRNEARRHAVTRRLRAARRTTLGTGKR